MRDQSNCLRETKSCPFCAEQIKLMAVKCRFCGSFLDTAANVKRPLKDHAQQPATADDGTKQPRPSGLDMFLQFIKGLEQLTIAGLWLTVAVGLFLLLRSCS